MNIESPCIDVCQLSEDKTVCTGCHRLVSEIQNWRYLADEEKLRVIAAAQARGVVSQRDLTSERIP
jgi:uncharacterized protein